MYTTNDEITLGLLTIFGMASILNVHQRIAGVKIILYLLKKDNIALEDIERGNIEKSFKKRGNLYPIRLISK